MGFWDDASSLGCEWSSLLWLMFECRLCGLFPAPILAVVNVGLFCNLLRVTVLLLEAMRGLYKEHSSPWVQLAQELPC